MQFSQAPCLFKLKINKYKIGSRKEVVMFKGTSGQDVHLQDKSAHLFYLFSLYFIFIYLCSEQIIIINCDKLFYLF